MPKQMRQQNKHSGWVSCNARSTFICLLDECLDFVFYRSFDLVAMQQFWGQKLDVENERKINDLIGLWTFDQLTG